jgi:hypothetical protein
MDKTQPIVAAGRALVLDASDNVATALGEIAPGTYRWARGPGTEVTVEVREPIPAGFKVAIEPIAAGAPVRKYGHVVARAVEPIPAGAKVHVHNTRSTVQ